jgi:PAS domain S-box-containing protein
VFRNPMNEAFSADATHRCVFCIRTTVYIGGGIIAAIRKREELTERGQRERDRERLLTELHESQRLFSGIAEATPDVIYLFDLRTEQTIYHNGRLQPTLGYTPEEFRQHDVIDALAHAGDRASIRSHLAGFETLKEGGVIDFEYRLLHKEGRWVWFHSRAVIFLRDGTGRPRVILGVAQDITERKRNDEALLRIQEELERRVAERTAQLIHAEEETRRRIARELHDEMGQHVTALKIGLESLRGNGGDAPRIAQLTGMVRELDQRIDRLAHELRSSALEDFGLAAALSSYVDDFSGRSGIRVDLYDAASSAVRFEPLIETTIYRVAQEALTNVLKHARARSVSVILERRERQVGLIVEDDGGGFEMDRAVPHRKHRDHRLGLIGMRERVALAGGTLLIESRVGGGTSIFVRLPIGD